MIVLRTDVESEHSTKLYMNKLIKEIDSVRISITPSMRLYFLSMSVSCFLYFFISSRNGFANPL